MSAAANVTAAESDSSSEAVAEAAADSLLLASVVSVADVRLATTTPPLSFAAESTPLLASNSDTPVLLP